MPPTPKSPVPPIPCQVPQPPAFPPSPNVKKIFLFLDGTGNEFIPDADPKKANSNVVKLYTTLKVAGDQVAYYHPGVGTMGDPTIRWRIPRYWSMTKGLAFGAGFKANVLDAYRYLMEVYNDGDQIYIFGFSRGSYTARALASLLHGYGLLCRGNEGHLLYAWKMMIDQMKCNRKRLKIPLFKRKGQNAHTIKRNDSYAQTFSRIVTIRFMGIWDTVSSVGWIYTPIRLLDGAQNPIIQVGRHAVSIDERRAFYRDNLWGKLVDISNPEWPATLKKQGIQQDITQVWFPGAHSDVGGSYAQTEAGPANEALRWMIDEVQQHGAQLCQERIDMVLGKPSGLLASDAAYRPPNPPENKLHDPLKGFWWILQFFPQQYYDKDDGVLQWRVPLSRARAIPNHAIIHGSAKPGLRQTADGPKLYQPANLSKLETIDLTDSAVASIVTKTTANLTGCFLHKTKDGKVSVPDDPTPVRYAKLLFGWFFFGIFWLFLASVIVFLIGGCRILAAHVFHFLNQCAWIHSLFRLLHYWLIG
jgi:uncharacterized protein (DUF2235 family)